MADDRTPNETDPKPEEPGRPFDRKDGHSGQEYDRDGAADLAAGMPEGSVDPQGTPRRGSPPRHEHRDIPREDGVRAYFDPETGEVHGSGAGAGGGNPGEDYDVGTPGTAKRVPDHG